LVCPNSLSLFIAHFAETARIKLGKKEAKAAQRKKLLTPLALDKLTASADPNSPTV
jgi:hypothetical protein